MSHKNEFKHDVVRESIVSAFGFIKRDSKVITRYSLIAVAVVLLAIAYNAHQHKSALSANEEFGEAVNSFIDGNPDLAFVDFQSIVDRYNGISSAINARLYLIQEEIKTKDYPSAIDNISYVLDNSDNKQILASMWMVKGNIALTENDFEQCKKFYDNAIKIQPLNSIKDDYKIELARLYIKQDKYGDAKKILDALTKNPELRYNIKNDAEDLLAEVNYRLR